MQQGVSSPGRVIPWRRLVPGMAIHLVAPAYVLTLIVDAVAGRAPGALGPWLTHALWLSGWFMVVYGGAALVLTLAGGVVDRMTSGAGCATTIAAGASDLAAILAGGRGVFGAEAERQIERIAATRLDPSDSAVRTMGRDLVELFATARVALAAAPADRPELTAMVTRALTSMADTCEQKARESATLAGDEARAMAHYVKSKYS